MISTPKNSTGAAENCAKPEQDQVVIEGCGTLGPIEGSNVFDGPPSPLGTVRWLIDEYRTDCDSPYHSKRWPTRCHYDVLCKRIAADFGTYALEDIRARQLFLTPCAAWTAVRAQSARRPTPGPI